MKRSARIGQIVSCMQLALDRAGTPEGELAAKRADELRTRFDISTEEIECRPEDDPMQTEQFDASRALWRRELITTIGILCECFITHGVFNKSRMQLSGRKSDVEVARFLLDSASVQMGRAMKRWREKLGLFEPDRVDCRLWRESYVTGVEVKCYQILAARRRRREADSSALVPIGRAGAAEEWRRGESPVQDAEPPDRSLDAVSGHGYHSGKAVNLNSAIGTSSAVRLSSDGGKGR